MNKRSSTTKHLSWALACGALVAASAVAIASDHDEADTDSFTLDGADIGDLYAFHGDQRLTLIMTFDGYKLRSEEASYSADFIYGFHVDTDADNQADHEIWARFGQNAAGDWGVQVEGIPGQESAMVAAVGEVGTDADTGAEIFAGLRDDPFFFDLEGFDDTLMTGALAFDPSRDFVALKNTLAVAVEFDHAQLGSDSVAVWATTGRL